MKIVPVTIREAKPFVRDHHRHLPAVAGAKFAIGLEHDDALIGVALLGRPVSASLAEDRLCAEAIRVCTLSSAPKGAASKLNARLKRIWQLHGGTRYVTYNRADESGASMRGAGLIPVARVRGRQWSCPSRPRAASKPVDKVRWEASLAEIAP